MTIEEEIARAIGGVLFNVSNFPEKAQSRLWGQDMKPLNDKLTVALSPLLNRVRAEGAAEAIQAHRDLHPTYGSTAACGGGMGGMTLTEHCAVVCQNPKHDAAKAAWHEVEMDYFDPRRIEQNSEGNET